jgi:hypothetical protein
MRPAEKLQRIIKAASFTASPEVDQALWIDTLRARAEQKKTAAASRRRLIWEIAMRYRIVQLAAVAVVLATALAIGVETFRPSKPDKTYAFSAEIRANTALDLDPKAALPLKQVQPQDFDVTWDGENGGTLRIMPGSSLRLLTPPSGLNPKWENVVDWAHSILAELGKSTATSVSAREKRFAAILTSEGNLAVVEIGKCDESKAQLQWQVESTDLPGYGPLQVVTLASFDPNNPSARPCAIDFDTGRTSAIPAQVLKLAPKGFLGWLEQNGIDAIAKMTGGAGGLSGVGLAFQTGEAGVWAVIPATAIRDAMSHISYQSRDPILFREGQYQFIHPFKTREGGLGVLQMCGMDRTKQTVQFRYKMVQKDPPAGIEAEKQNDEESVQLYRSAEWMNRLGRSLLFYASEHDDRLPQSLEEIKKYADNEEHYRWIMENVKYLGAGLTCAQSPSLAIAYDKTLLAKGKGTHVVFLDSHIELVEPERLTKLGLLAKP